jgi:hypothetical protein
MSLNIAAGFHRTAVTRDPAGGASRPHNQRQHGREQETHSVAGAHWLLRAACQAIPHSFHATTVTAITKYDTYI